MTTETKADDFKVGDIVYCVMYGRGVVEEVCNSADMLGVAVSFDKGDFNWYTKDGRYNIELNRTLFFSEPKIEASVTRPFVPTLVGKRVVLRYKDGSYFAEHAVLNEETSTQISSDADRWFKDEIQAIYEVSSENLLK